MWILNLKIESTGGLSYWCGFHFASYAGGKKKYSQLTLNWKNLRSQQCLLQNPSATQQLCYFQHLWLRLHGDQLNGFLRWHQMAADAIIPTTGDRNMIGADRDNGEISSNSLRIDSRASGDHLKCGLWFNSVGKSNKWDVSPPPTPPKRKDRCSLWLLTSRILSLQPRQGWTLVHVSNTDVIHSSLMHLCSFVRGKHGFVSVSRDRRSERARVQTEGTYSMGFHGNSVLLVFHHWSQVSLGDESGICVSACWCVCVHVCVHGCGLWSPLTWKGLSSCCSSSAAQRTRGDLVRSDRFASVCQST